MLYPLVTFARLDKIDSTESSKREQPNVRAASAAFTLNCWQKANIHSLFVFTVYWPIADDDDDDSIDALQCGTTKPNTHRFVCPFVRNLHTHTHTHIHIVLVSFYVVWLSCGGALHHLPSRGGTPSHTNSLMN